MNRSVAADQVLPVAQELASRLAQGPTRTLGLTKRLYRRSLSNDMATSFEEERTATALISTTADRKEGVMSFIEGRPPTRTRTSSVGSLGSAVNTPVSNGRIDRTRLAKRNAVRLQTGPQEFRNCVSIDR